MTMIAGKDKQMETKLFDKVKCKGFYKPHRDGLYIELDKENLTATLKTSAFNVVEEDVEEAEKTYFKHVPQNFSGVVVGYKDLVIVGYLDVLYDDAIDTGIGTIPEKYYIAKRPKDVVKCAIVYYADNKKHYVPLEDIVEIIDRWDKNQNHRKENEEK